jgi:hypothetical protein
MSIAKPFEVRHPTREDCEGDGSSIARTDRAVNSENWRAGLLLLAMTVVGDETYVSLHFSGNRALRENVKVG